MLILVLFTQLLKKNRPRHGCTTGTFARNKLTQREHKSKRGIQVSHFTEEIPATRRIIKHNKFTEPHLGFVYFIFDFLSHISPFLKNRHTLCPSAVAVAAAIASKRLLVARAFKP